MYSQDVEVITDEKNYLEVKKYIFDWDEATTCEETGVKPGRAGWLCFGAYLPALILAVGVVLWANYNYGVPRSYGWNFQRIPVMPFWIAPWSFS